MLWRDIFDHDISFARLDVEHPIARLRMHNRCVPWPQMLRPQTAQSLLPRRECGHKSTGRIQSFWQAVSYRFRKISADSLEPE